MTDEEEEEEDDSSKDSSQQIGENFEYDSKPNRILRTESIHPVRMSYGNFIGNIKKKTKYCKGQ